MNPIFIIRDNDTLRPIMAKAYETVKKGLAAGPVVVKLGREKRTLEQNAKLWPMLTDISSQIIWHGQYLDNEDWKDIFTASLKKQKAVPGIDGGFVVLGARTSKMEKKEFSDLIELIYAFGAERDVKWSEQAIDAYEKYR